MAYAVFNDGATDGREPWVDYEFTDEPLVEILGEKAPGQTERVELFACLRRRYRWPGGFSEPQREAWEEFLRLRGILRDTFLVEDPRDPVREPHSLLCFQVQAKMTLNWWPKQGKV